MTFLIDPALTLRGFASLILVASLWITQPSAAQNTSQQDTSQQDLSDVIAADLSDSERIASSSIEVKELDGYVTLSGTADSLLDKRYAERIAKRTRGVKAVINQVFVKPTDRDDEAIRSDVLKVLSANGAVDRPQLVVNVRLGEVSMVGKVDSLAEKRIAEMAVGSVRGVRDINNQLTVGLRVDRSDRDLQQEINTLLVHSVYLDDVELDITVDDGIATLSGTVRNATQKDVAERVASIPGIVQVKTEEIKIDDSFGDPSIRKQRYADVTDKSIADVLERVFRVDPLLFDVTDSISLSVDSGVVTLNGAVNRLIEKSRAASLATGVVGVRRVVNELKVERSDDAPTDLEIIEETQAALLRSANVDRSDVRVHCQRAHVSLYGVVDGEMEKQIAGWLADSVSGVVHVNNNLAVERPSKGKSDQQIESDLKRKLKYALFDASDDIDVRVENGVAVLSGEVDTWRQWQAALDLALEAGAEHPHNLIDVRYHNPHSSMRTFVPN